MSTFHREYDEAYDTALDLARSLKGAVLVGIRKQTEYGVKGFSVSMVSPRDSDYWNAEIVRATDPKIQRRPICPECNGTTETCQCHLLSGNVSSDGGIVTDPDY
jgi:hypothetical protein